MKLKDKVAVVTGASSGIGKAIAKLFAAEGAKIVMASRNEENGKKVEAEINQANKEASLFVKTDVSKESDVKNLMKQTEEKFNKIDILVNNAGVFSMSKLEDLSEKEWDRILDINLKGAFLCSKYALPLLKKNKGGVMINIASSFGLVPANECSVYCASKAGLNMLTKVNAIENAADNIRVNSICPGPIDTPMLRQWLSEEAKTDEKVLLKDVLIKRIGKPEEVAKLAIFLASDDASYITGAIMSIDGGESVIGCGAPE